MRDAVAWSRILSLSSFLLWRKNSTGRNCEAEKSFIRSKVCVEEHMGKHLEWVGISGDGLDCLYGGNLLVSAQSPCLSPYLSLGSSLVGACTSLRQYRLQYRGFWEIGRAYYGMTGPPFFGPSLDWGHSESHFLSRLIRSLGVPKEREFWDIQGGRKDKLFNFFSSTFLRII